MKPRKHHHPLRCKTPDDAFIACIGAVAGLEAIARESLEALMFDEKANSYAGFKNKAAVETWKIRLAALVQVRDSISQLREVLQK